MDNIGEKVCFSHSKWMILRKNSIQTALIINYALVITPLVVMLFFAFFSYSSSFLSEKASESLNQMSANISAQIDAELMNMNAITVKFVYSDVLRRLVFREDSEFEGSNIALSRLFNEYIFVISGPDGRGISQISALNRNGNFATAGYERNYVAKLSREETDAYPFWEEALALEGGRYISAPYTQTNTRERRTVISLCRVFSEEYAGAYAAIVDVQLDYDVIGQIISRASNGQKTYVFTRRGELVYPLGAEDYAYYQNLGGGEVTTLTGMDGKKELVAGARSDFSGFTVITADDAEAMALPITRFRDALVLFGLITIALILVISWLISRRISRPILRIRNEIRNLRLNDPPDEPDANRSSGIIEIDDLDGQFQMMRGKLKASLENELQTRMLALQSQMNPHFLYNTLTTIQIMGKEIGDERIVSVCDNLSSMLRYISSTNTDPVPMSAEMGYTQNYIHLMSVRYPDKLTVLFDIPKELYPIKIPRLVIQPLVENAIKHGTNIYPPWVISITGTIGDGANPGWRVYVRDNGRGFSESAIGDLERRITSAGNNLPDLALDGMGLVNIYTRMRLSFGDKAEFNTSNMPEGGAEVMVGVGE